MNSRSRESEPDDRRTVVDEDDTPTQPIPLWRGTTTKGAERDGHEERDADR
jgi:hypothetical protein